ncbi:DoxX family protein [uncultured Methylobacterium sp.]|jgi:putative oxidoreductase|uniref:DoxX family protein n=1 Tax=uncultured Methylobacterium sp. TaxID=157278 RepID=UPI00262222C5|nr:DoxX family protein [uncultured Methylobacterium sp.]
MSQMFVAPAAAPTRSRNMAAWVLQVVLALAFLGAGGAKLTGVPMMVESFDRIGLGQWFRIVTGLVEIVGAVALLVPGYALFGAIWLAITMAGAILAHLLVLPTPAAPAVVLLVLNAAVAWLRRDQAARVAPRLR